MSRTSSARATGKNARSDRSPGDRRLGTRDALFPLLRRVSANHRAHQTLAMRVETGVRPKTSSLDRRTSLTSRPPLALAGVQRRLADLQESGYEACVPPTTTLWV
jgi:hypothetical protein